MMKVTLYFDFVSPYVWLALKQAKSFAAQHDVTWELRPVVYAAMLRAHGLVGPVETEAKRRYTFQDIKRIAGALDLSFKMPPLHPYRSMEALRTQFLFRHESAALELALQLSDACWGKGHDLTNSDVLQEIVARVGLDGTDLMSRIAAPEIKQGLRASTNQAIAADVFGVPTFASKNELFWGHDRMDQLAASFLLHDERAEGLGPGAAS